MKKTLYTLNVDNYSPEITALTYPLLRRYADKIGAEFYVINEKRFPDWPVTYSKLAIYEIAKERQDDWIIYIDSDAVVHPDFFDVTDHLGADTVAHNGRDFAGNRWRYDDYFRRDGRHIGSCNWFAVASSWCLDLWRPLDDLTLAQALANISPTPFEASPFRFKTTEKDTLVPVPLPDAMGGGLGSGGLKAEPKGQRIPDGKGGFEKEPKAVITPEHLIDDYVLSRNIAKFSLKHTTVIDIQQRLNDKGNYLWHAYTVDVETKVRQIKDTLVSWQIDHLTDCAHS